MPLSGLLADCPFGWPSIFYVFGAMGTIWCVFFLVLVHEDPQCNKRMSDKERLYIQQQLESKLGMPVSFHIKNFILE